MTKLETINECLKAEVDQLKSELDQKEASLAAASEAWSREAEAVAERDRLTVLCANQAERIKELNAAVDANVVDAACAFWSAWLGDEEAATVPHAVDELGKAIEVMWDNVKMASDPAKTRSES